MNTANKEPHSDIEELLPWHAAGTLSRRDTLRVEEALARDPELARRYALVREELGETILLNNRPFTVVGVFEFYEREQDKRRRQLALEKANAKATPAPTPARKKVSRSGRGSPITGNSSHNMVTKRFWLNALPKAATTSTGALPAMTPVTSAAAVTTRSGFSRARKPTTITPMPTRVKMGSRWKRGCMAWLPFAGRQ